MIGTHDSYTFLPAKKKFYELFSFLWRTQTKNIKEQKEAGVTYFDIRVRRHSTRPVWVVCHGIVDFDLRFESLEQILNCFTAYNVRIILERGNKDNEILFIDEALKVLKFPNLKFIGIKRKWHVINDSKFPAIMDYTYTPWLSHLSFWGNIKRFNFFSTIKRWAKKHNPKITEELIDNKNVVHFMDYV